MIRVVTIEDITNAWTREQLLGLSLINDYIENEAPINSMENAVKKIDTYLGLTSNYNMGKMMRDKQR